MKVWVIFIILLIIPLVNSKDVVIQEVFETPDKVISGETTYFYAGSKLLASKNDDIVTYHYQDRLGSDINSKSLPFGQSLKVLERFSFTGKELDEELYYFNARYYDPNLGRFTSVDPVKDNLPYVYVNNNPMNFIDPTGMDERYVKVQNMVVGDINRYEDAIKYISDRYEVDPKVMASIIYVERVQYEFDTMRKLKADLAKIDVIKWFMTEVDLSVGFTHLKYSARSNSKDLASGHPIEVTSTSNALYPDTTRTITAGMERNSDLVYNVAADEFFESTGWERWEKQDQQNIVSIGETAVILKVLENIYSHVGHDISDSPNLLGTVYNIGIRNVFPDPNRQPRAGGTTFPYVLNGKHIKGDSFGKKVQDVYDSNLFSDY